MNDIQRMKRNFRNTKAFKEYKKKKAIECGKVDKITQKPLRKNFSFHHEDLREENYTVLNDNFLCCNNLTHKMIHWLWTYYKTDPQIVERLRAEMEKMAEINKEEWKLNDSCCGV